MENLCFVVVNYNKKIDDLSSIKKITNYELYILDNSDNISIKQYNKSIIGPPNVHYLDMEGNVGLSKAYNKSLQIIKNKYKYVGFLDDDTELSDEYFELLEKELNNGYKIIMPKIKNKYDDKIRSPYFKHYLQAINSCTVYKTEIFDKYRFNEDLFMYYVDVDFFDLLKIKKSTDYKVLDTCIRQNFSYYEKVYDSEVKKAVKRILKDSKIRRGSNKFGHLLDKVYFIKEIFKTSKDPRCLLIILY